MTAIRPHARGGAFARGWRAFRRWRRSRPFWGGLLTALGGLFIFGTTQMSLGGLSFQMGPTGFLSWLIPTALVACGLLAWFTPNQRMFYAIIAAVTALYSLIGVNLGGFFIGMLLGVVGAGLIFAWTPVPVAAAEAADTAELAAVDGDDQAEPAPQATVDDLMTGPTTDVLPPARNPFDDPHPGGQHRAAGRDDDAAPEVPAPPHRPEVPGTGTSAGPGGRLYAVTLLVVSLAAAGAVALPLGSSPAYAQGCPIEKPTQEAQKPAEEKPADQAEEPAPAPAAPTPEPTTTPAPDGEEPAEDGTVIEDIVEGVVDGVKDILGIGGDQDDPAPAPEPTPTATPERPAPAPTTSAPVGSAKKPEKKKTGPAVKTVDSVEDLRDCTKEDLRQPGPVVRIAAEDGQPIVADPPSKLTGTRVTMFGLSYDGVVNLPTREGTVEVLQFSMDRSVTDDFELVTPNGGGRTTSLRSSALTVRGNVKFYASRFHGSLLGIPLTFTPESPPPLTLPIMTFGDPEIDLVFVDCDVLDAPDLVVTPS